ncbi:MAG TPA: ABC transporter permease [Candidatus Polarisedimenticolia bacterium]|jgi:ABC-2 type transport system permease protein|nr:ABC transporter permease [Candidatus Polarisedimenticolia bacterium]
MNRPVGGAVVNAPFAFGRFWGVVLKEFLQLRRDRITFAMIVGVPVLQLVLFGYAINSDPKHLRTAIIAGDSSEFTRTYLATLRTSQYFEFVGILPDEEAGRAALDRGQVQFVVNIPADFTRRLLRGERPAVLVEADATDPSATGSAIAALHEAASVSASRDLTGPLAALREQPPPFEVLVHRLYNPEGITQRNIVPSLMGVILTMTMAMMTGLAMTRERERGTMENLLATPARPLEVMTGKIMPYIAIGLIQVSIILIAARLLFGVPFEGSLVSLYSVALLLIAANLAVGITISSLAQNQLQAMQLTFFYFLPSILLSGFMFPFQGMPVWARAIGNLLPMTWFNRMVRGIVLKGVGWTDLWPNAWPVMIFTVAVMSIAMLFYRRTLD